MADDNMLTWVVRNYDLLKLTVESLKLIKFKFIPALLQWCVVEERGIVEETT